MKTRELLLSKLIFSRNKTAKKVSKHGKTTYMCYNRNVILNRVWLIQSVFGEIQDGLLDTARHHVTTFTEQLHYHCGTVLT